MRYIIILLISFCFTMSFSQEQDSFYQVDVIQKIEIETPTENWVKYLDSIYLNGDDYLFCTVVINDNRYPFSGIRYAKNLTNLSRSKKSSFEIKLDLVDKTQHHNGYSDIVLSEALRDPSMVREVLYMEMARKFMHASKANYAVLTINNQSFGVMTNIEAVNDDFINKRFGDADGTLISAGAQNAEKSKEMSDVCLKEVGASLLNEKSPLCYFNDFQLISDGGWDDLMELTFALDNDALTADELNDIINVDQLLWYLALNNLTVNLKSYIGANSGNYYLYRNPEGQFYIFPWAVHLSFGSFKNTGTGSDLSIEKLQKFSPYSYSNDSQKPLVSKVMSYKENEMKYKAFYHELYSEFLKSGWYSDRIDQLQTVIKNERFKEGKNYYDYEQFLNSKTEVTGKVSKIPGISSFLKSRRSYLKTVDLNTDLAPKITDISFKTRDELSSNRIEDYTMYVRLKGFPKRVHLYYKLDNKDSYEHMLLKDDGSKPDKKAKDKVYSIKVPGEGSSSMDYYIKTENIKMEAYYPANYTFEKYNIDLEEINK